MSRNNDGTDDAGFQSNKRKRKKWSDGWK